MAGIDAAMGTIANTFAQGYLVGIGFVVLIVLLRTRGGE